MTHARGSGGDAAVVAEQLAEPCQRAAEQLARCGLGPVHPRGDLLVAQAHDARESDHLAVLVGEVLERAVEQHELLPAGGVATRREPMRDGREVLGVAQVEGRLLLRIATLAPMEALLLPHLVERRREEPAQELVLALVPELVEMLDQLAADGLDDVHAALAQAQCLPHAQAHIGAQAREMAADELVDRGRIAARRGFDQAARAILVHDGGGA
jgi:hypothetical protein